MDVRIDRLWHTDSFGIWIFKDRDGSTEIAKPVKLEFESHPESFRLPEPTLQIRTKGSQQFFQAMINEFCKQGLRPDNEKIAGLYEAQTKHLEDMRAIALGIKK